MTKYQTRTLEDLQGDLVDVRDIIARLEDLREERGAIREDDDQAQYDAKVEA